MSSAADPYTEIAALRMKLKQAHAAIEAGVQMVRTLGEYLNDPDDENATNEFKLSAATFDAAVAHYIGSQLGRRNDAAR